MLLTFKVPTKSREKKTFTDVIIYFIDAYPRMVKCRTLAGILLKAAFFFVVPKRIQ